MALWAYKMIHKTNSNIYICIIFTASIGSVDSLYPSVFIYCMNLHQFLILCSSKAMMFVKLYFRTSDIYLISPVSVDPSGFCELNRCHPLKRNQYMTCTASVVVNISASWTFFFGDVSVAQLVASTSGVVLGGVATVVGSNLFSLSTVWICISCWSCVARKQWCLWNYISELLIFI